MSHHRPFIFFHLINVIDTTTQENIKKTTKHMCLSLSQEKNTLKSGRFFPSLCVSLFILSWHNSIIYSQLNKMTKVHCTINHMHSFRNSPNFIWKRNIFWRFFTIDQPFLINAIYFCCSDGYSLMCVCECLYWWMAYFMFGELRALLILIYGMLNRINWKSSIIWYKKQIK